MSMSRLRPLAAALLLAGACGSAAAADLMQAYQLARQSDPVLQQADANRLATGENVVQSRAALLPSLSGTASLGEAIHADPGESIIDPATGEVIGVVGGGGNVRSRSYNVTLGQSIFNASNYTRLRSDRARTESANASYDATSDQLMLRVSQAYFDVLTAIDSLAFSRAERRAVKRQLDQAEQRFEVGLTAITDVHEARARYDGARATEIAAENFLDDAREALTEITGQQLAGFKGLGENFEPTLPQPAEIERWVQIAIDNSPTLLAREYNLRAAGHDVDTARAGHLPTLRGSVGWGETASWPGGSNGDEGTTVGLTLTVPIFEGFATQSRVRQAVYTRDATEDQFEQERRAVTRQTRNSYRALEAGISEIGARAQALVSARSALEATEAGFEVGTRTIVDVLLSQQLLFQAQRDFSQSRHNYLVNGLRLRTAAGTIEVKDLQDVNRYLVSDAEAALVETDEAETMPATEATPATPSND